MDEKRKTIFFGGAAIVLLLLVLITSPRSVTPEAFLDQGEAFFPEFTDPNQATSLEVIDYDEATGEALPFKVLLKDGKWSIPSHHDYPADGKDRLAKTAAGVIDIKKDDFRTNNVADHEACGVIDPLDETETSLEGRGTRVTLKAENDKVLADFIIGKEIPDRTGFRFVRVPEQKRVYMVRMNIDISTKFSDWIEPDLLQVTKSDIKELTIKDYSINERSGQVNQRDQVILKKDGDNWNANKLSSNQEVDKTKVNDLLSTIDDLSIVGVRNKPQGLSRSLSRSEGAMRIGQGDLLSLQSKGYFFTRDGQLLSNEGETKVHTKDGVIYTLRFGEIVYGSGIDVSAGAETNTDEDSGPAENRYLFITTEFESSEFIEPANPNNTDFQTKADSLWTDADRKNKEKQDTHNEWQENIDKGSKLSNELNERFANWYYVISSESFDKIHLKRKDLVKAKEEES